LLIALNSLNLNRENGKQFMKKNIDIGDAICTSNFFKTKNIDNVVCISRGYPKWYRGDIDHRLAPTWKMLKENYTKEDYYKKILSKLDARKIYEEHKGKILLCWEGDGEICHRHWIAEWLEKKLKIKIAEYRTPQELAKIELEQARLNQLDLF
jgi:hypothetical protein